MQRHSYGLCDGNAWSDVEVYWHCIAICRPVLQSRTVLSNTHKLLRPIHTHSMPRPCHFLCHAVNSHMPCHTPALLRQCRVLCESPCGSQKYLNYYSNSLTDHLFCSVLLPLFTVVAMDRCEEDCYASDNSLRGTPHGSRKKTNMALRRMAWSEHGMGVAWQV